MIGSSPSLGRSLCGYVHTASLGGAYAGGVHELSVCEALLSQVAAIARERGAGVVRHIVIEMGPLSGVEPELLARAFSIARAGGCAAHAELSIEPTLIRVECMGCGANTRAAANRLLCGACGGYRTRVVAGDELRLRRVELSMETRTASAEL